MTDYPDWTVPQAHANAIAATGAPLITLSNVLASQSFLNAGAGATQQTAMLAVSQVGYEVVVNAQCDPAATVPFAEVRLEWTDVTTGLVVASDAWTVPMATNANGFTIVGRGPTKADQLVVKVTNRDSVAAPKITITALQNSRVYTDDDWRWNNKLDNGLTVPGFVLATLPDDQSVLGMIPGTAIGAGATTNFLFGTGRRQATLTLGSNPGLLSTLNVRIAAMPASEYPAGNVILAVNGAANAVDLTLPQAPLQVALTNTSGASVTIFGMLISKL